jgi:chromosome segregation ATPase
MKALNNKPVNIVNEINSNINEIDKLNTQIERTQKTIKKYQDELDAYYEMGIKSINITDEIFSIKESLAKCSESDLNAIEGFAKLLLVKIKTLNDINKKLQGYGASDIETLESKINHNISLNIKRSNQVNKLMNKVN